MDPLPPYFDNRSFYKVLGKSSSEATELKIPPPFWNDTKEALLPGPVLLKSGIEGRLWPVQLVVKDEQNVYLRDGWAAFLEENKLEAGKLLLFTHLQGSTLLVEVCFQADMLPSERPKEEKKPMESSKRSVGEASKRQKNKGKYVAKE